MVDRASATIQIGGVISAALIDELIEAIDCDNGKADWDGNPVEASCVVDGKILEVCAHQLIGGQFDHVEAFCDRHGIAYVRTSDPCIGAFGAERVVYTGDGPLRAYEVNEAERVVLTRCELNQLGSIEAANAWFEASEYTPPPITIISGDERRSSRETSNG